MGLFVPNLSSSVQSTLFAVLALFLAAAAFRYLRIGRTGGGWMLAGALSMFLVQVPFVQGFLSLGMHDAFVWLLEWPVMAAMRGAILGTALSVLIFTIRYLLLRLK